MPQPALIYRVLVASPGDCNEERDLIPQVIYSWNAAHSWHTGAILEPVLWETHSRPELGDRPQGIINRQLVQNCDILVGAFWTRLGTSTGKAASGTAEEIQQFYDSGRRVLLYFSNRAVNYESVDRKQFDAMRKYRDQMRKLGVVWSYDTIGDFGEAFRQHLASTMAELHGTSRQLNPTASPTDARSHLKSVIRTFAFSWNAERDSEPDDIEGGKMLLQALLTGLTECLTQHTAEEDSQPYNPLTALMRDIRSLSRRELRSDAGRSYQAFWDEGDRTLHELQTYLSRTGEQWHS